MAFNIAMDALTSTSLINAAGGDAAFAKLLGIDQEKGAQQRVNNWKRRGIPPAVVLEHLGLIKKLQAKIAAPASQEAV